MRHYIEDYSGIKREVKGCPKCGEAPDINDCGPEAQGLSCWKCSIHAMVFEEIGSKAMLLEAIKKWNDGEFEEEDV